MMGRAGMRGKQVTVELILDRLGAEETIEQVLQSHPRLRRAAFAALEFGARAPSPRRGGG
jgi:uncharacterized protein (DUF433 family)